jgi:hypothetical protein
MILSRYHIWLTSPVVHHRGTSVPRRHSPSIAVHNRFFKGRYGHDDGRNVTMGHDD